MPHEHIHQTSIPLQQMGNELSIERSITLHSHEAAKTFFKEAVERLLNVNGWHMLTGSALSIFQLTDSHAQLVNRQQARVNDYFRINIPAPGTQAGEGYDWVKVEMIDQQKNIYTGKESVAMRVRPVPNPHNPQAGTAHFFNDEATSTFTVLRKGEVVTAAVYGRNEVPNTEGNVLDTIRNTTVALGAMLGGAKLQWESLVKGILNIQEK